MRLSHKPLLPWLVVLWESSMVSFCSCPTDDTDTLVFISPSLLLPFKKLLLFLPSCVNSKWCLSICCAVYLSILSLAKCVKYHSWGEVMRLNPVAEVVVPREQMPIFLHLFSLIKHRGRMAFWDPSELWLLCSCWAGGSGLDRWAQTGSNTSSFGCVMTMSGSRALLEQEPQKPLTSGVGVTCSSL